MENENSDIWWSKDGANWNQITEIYGDFLQGIGNEDAKIGGSTAPCMLLLCLILFRTTDIREFTPFLSFTSQGTAGTDIHSMH
jgi:hypothetical protein